MKVDKENNNCLYNDEAHVYWNKQTERKYISVTTLIGKYKKPFKDDSGKGFLWSEYKAIQKYVGDIVFEELKAAVGFEKVVHEWKKQCSIEELEDLPILAKMIRDDWEKTKYDACERGSQYHLAKENYWLSKAKHIIPELSKAELKTDTKYDLTIQDGIYPEFLVYNDEHNIAGQIDLLIKTGNEFTIIDYKTNKELKKRSYFNPKTRKSERMLYPCNKLDDVNFNHYQLQLNMYAWMIEQLNPEYKVTTLEIEYIDHDGNESTHTCKHMRKTIENIIKHYEKNKE